ncbi:MAG: response regulator transcription factor [Faecalibacterium sp.]|jgi:DNA-binding response OmpR family regulator|nr:response regulator transcription factor [Faecalibacterium sp.]
MESILICDDNADIVEALKIYLGTAGYTLYTADDGAEAIAAVEQHDIHLILMDIMMPKMDGLTATAKLREKGNIPIILLTAKSEESDMVLGLGVGADDYITKPFRPVELLARVKAVLRRYTALGGAAKAPGTLAVNGIVLDDGSKTVQLDGEAVSLTPLEYKLLKFLMESPGQVFSGKALYRAVWGEAPLSGEGAVAVHIRHLREKLEIDPAHPRRIKVVWGQGYKLEKEGVL